ncbi:MAG: TetR family transcriptional regulator BpeR [Burkholderiaceae bacterium]
MARSTKQEAQKTRNRILDAAEEVFHAQGVSRTSLDDVARAADVTRGAIYWHFKNKSDLFDAMAQRVKLPMEAMVEAGGDEGTVDPLGQIRASLIFVLQETARNPQSRAVFEIIFLKCEFVAANDTIWNRRREEFNRGLLNFQRTVANAIHRGQLPTDLDVVVACSALQAMIVGLINNWLLMSGPLDLGTEAPRLVDACLDMVKYASSLRASQMDMAYT